MKIFAAGRCSLAIAVGLAFASGTAAASSWQRSCETADGSVQLVEGQVQRGRALTLVPGDDAAETVGLASAAYRVIEGAATVIEASTSGCDGMGGEIVIMYTSQISEVEMRIERLDGEAFPAGLPGLSADARAMDVTMICEFVVSGQGQCPAE